MYTSADKLFNHLFSLSRNGNLIYRGIKKDNEKYPTILRAQVAGKSNDLSTFEEKILSEFARYGCSLVNGNLNPIDLVGYAQHFGLPTRLVDWTYNPFVALYFSINGDDYDTEKVYKLLIMNRYKQINLSKIFYSKIYTTDDTEIIDSGIGDYIKFIKTISNKKVLVAALSNQYQALFNNIDSVNRSYVEVQEKIDQNRFIVLNMNYSNPRIIAQQGLFVIPKNLAFADVNDEYLQSEVEIIEIEKALKQTLLDYLNRININKRRLFFDLQNICDDIKREVYEQSENLGRLLSSS